MNLLEGLTSQLTGGSTLTAISNLLGENETATKSGISAALPIIMGSFIKNGSTTEGASNLMNLIKTGGHDGSILDNLPNVLSGGNATTQFLNSGSSLVSSLFGGGLMSGVTNLIGNISGLKSGAVGTILNMVAPLVLSSIGRNVISKGLSLSGLTNLLKGQADYVKAALPAGASNLLGFSDLGKDVVNKVENTSTGLGKLLPWGLGLLALAALFYFWRGCETPKIETPAVVDKAAQAVKEAAQETKDAVADAANKVAEMFKVSLPGGVVLDVPKGSLEDRMVAFIQSNDTISKNLWFDFDRLLFETGQATLKPESSAQLANVAAIMKAFPKVDIKIGGYTDNVGKPADNMKLSAERAKNVMGELIKLGIDSKRMTSEGYGDQHPVADNSTEEGRAKNRRISISVRRK